MVQNRGPFILKRVKRLPITCCYILRNEEQFLSASLKSVVDRVSELVIVDFGSTDRTKEIAHSFLKRVPHFIWKDSTWENNFANARNSAASEAHEPWILFIDGDEILDEKAFSKISAAIAETTKISCYSFIQRNYTREPGLEEARRADSTPADSLFDHSSLYFLENWMERLYRRDKGLLYEGRIHESLLPSVQQHGLIHSRLPVVLHHYGRLKSKTPEKLKYYLGLTEQKWKEENDHPVPWIELAINLMELHEFEKAFDLAKRAVEKFPNTPEIIRVSFQAALRAEEFSLSEIWIKNFLKLKPKDLYDKSQLTTAYLYQKKFDDVFSLVEEIFREDPHNFVAHLNCGVIHFENKSWDNASRHLAIAHSERPEDLFVSNALKKVNAILQND
ncbi:MAG: glycosyltransferase [Bacteriovoracaceae bacterium]|nr:glycosyltransferase [Bacteriovoracaceae bacterium]